MGVAITFGPHQQPDYSTAQGPQTAASLTEVANYAAAVGNFITGTASQRNSNQLPLATGVVSFTPWTGLWWFETDTQLVYQYQGGWQLATLGFTNFGFNHSEVVTNFGAINTAYALLAAKQQFTMPRQGWVRLGVRSNYNAPSGGAGTALLTCGLVPGTVAGTGDANETTLTSLQAAAGTSSIYCPANQTQTGSFEFEFELAAGTFTAFPIMNSGPVGGTHSNSFCSVQGLGWA